MNKHYINKFGEGYLKYILLGKKVCPCCGDKLQKKNVSTYYGKWKDYLKEPVSKSTPNGATPNMDVYIVNRYYKCPGCERVFTIESLINKTASAETAVLLE